MGVFGIIINPRRACAERVIVVVRSVCLYVCMRNGESLVQRRAVQRQSRPNG